MRLDANVALQVRRGVEQMLEQDDILFVFVGLFGMAGNRSGNEDYFLRFASLEADEGTKETQKEEGKPVELRTSHSRCRECEGFPAADKTKKSLQGSRFRQTFRRVESDHRCLARGTSPT